LNKADIDSLKRKTEAYQASLQAAVQRALKKISRLPNGDHWEIERIVLALQDELIAIGESFIPQAVRLGYGSRPIDDKFRIKVDSLIQQNNQYVRSNFIPGFRKKVLVDIDWDEEEISIEESVEDETPGLLAWIALYGGAFWTAIWVGLGLSVEAIQGQGVGKLRIERVLDPDAQHCDTCPGKAGVYESWDEMLTVCGGLPGDFSDTCGSNCRCEIYVDIE